MTGISRSIVLAGLCAGAASIFWAAPAAAQECATDADCEPFEDCDEDRGECFCPDRDDDGHADERCGGDDCDETDPDRHPGNAEICDGTHTDDDCDSTTLGGRDDDGDGFVDANCCNPRRDGSGLRCGLDCDDGNSGANRLVPEVCNAIDDDCDSGIDEGVARPLYPDGDADGFGAAGAEALMQCAGEPGYSPRANDCDDSNPAIVPGAMTCGDDPAEVLVCSASGAFQSMRCPSETKSVCVSQPNGTGTCEPRRRPPPESGRP